MPQMPVFIMRINKVCRIRVILSLSHIAKLLPFAGAAIALKTEKNGTKTEYHGTPLKTFGETDEMVLTLHRK